MQLGQSKSNRFGKTAAAESAYRQYRAARWFLLPEGELCLRPAAMLDCKPCVAKWTRTGTGGGLENPAQQRYNCHQPFLAIIRTAGLAAPEPPNPLRSTVFKTAAINHSANPPSRKGTANLCKVLGYSKKIHKFLPVTGSHLAESGFGCFSSGPAKNFQWKSSR